MARLIQNYTNGLSSLYHSRLVLLQTHCRNKFVHTKSFSLNVKLPKMNLEQMISSQFVDQMLKKKIGRSIVKKIRSVIKPRYS